MKMIMLMLFVLVSCVGTIEDQNQIDKSTVNDPKQDFLFTGANSALWVSNTKLSVRFLPATGGSGNFRYQLLDEGGNVLSGENGENLLADSNGMMHLTYPGFPSGTIHRLLVRAIDIDRNIPETNTTYVTVNLPSDLYPDFDGIDSCIPSQSGGGTQVDIFWNKGGIYPNGLFGNLPHSVGSYRVYYCKKTDGTDCLEEENPKRGIASILNAEQENITIAGLDPNTDYFFRVIAVTEGISGDPSTQLEERNIEFRECKTQIANGPIVFEGITSVDLPDGEDGINEASVEWARATGSLEGYIVYYHPVLDENSVFNYLDANIQTKKILDPSRIDEYLIGLDSFTHHAFLVKACPNFVTDPDCNDGNDANGKFIVKQTKPNVAVFSGITSTSNDPLNPSNVFLNFTPADLSVGGIFDIYKVIISDGVNDYDVTMTTSSNTLGDIYPSASADYQDLYLDAFIPTDITSITAKLNGLKPGVVYQADLQAWVDRTSPLPIQGGNISAAYGSENTVPQAISNDDTTPPLVSSMTVSPLSGILVETDKLLVTINYNELLILSGAPRVGFNIGGVTRYADIVSSTSTSLSFEYEIVNGDNDLDGIAYATNEISLNGATLTDLSGNGANLNFVGVAPDVSLVRVDTTPPDPITNLTFTQQWISAINITQMASWINPPSDFAYAEIGIGGAGGGIPNAVAFTQASGTSTHTFPDIRGSLTECFADYEVLGRSVDAAGLMSTVVASAGSFKYDGTAPSTPIATLQGTTSDVFEANDVTWTAVTDNCELDHYEIAIGKDDESDGFASDDINNVLDWVEIPGGTAITQYQARSGVDGMTFSLNATEDFYVSIRGVDAGGNPSAPGSSASFIVDIAGPDTPANLTIASQWINGALPQDSPAASWVNPTNPDFDHIKVALGSSFGGEDVRAQQNIGTFTTYTWLGLDAGAPDNLTECTKYYPKVIAYDDIGNPSIPASDPNTWFIYDNTAPTLSGDIDTSAGGESLGDNKAPLADWLSSTINDNCNAIQKFEIAIGYDNDSDGFDAGDIENLTSFKDVPGGANITQYQVVSGQDGFNFVMFGGIDYYISLRAIDEAGNVATEMTASTPYSFTLDTTNPDVAITSGSSNPLLNATFDVEITFTEDVTGFQQTDMVVGNGTVTAFSGGPAVYNATITPSQYGTVSVDVFAGAALDGAGNANTNSNNFTILSSSNEPMVSIWQTSAPNESITLPLRSGFTYDMYVEWGDGTSDVIKAYNAPEITHTYANAGPKNVTIYGLMGAWRFNNGGSKTKIVSVTDLGDMGWVNFDGAFYGCTNLTSVSGGKTSGVTYMRNMFRQAPLLNPDTSTYDTSNVTDMHAMFYRSPLANPDVSGFDVSKVINLSHMFDGASVASPNTSSWTPVAATNMRYMFRDALVANPDVSGWDTSKVTDISYMFYNAENANPDVSLWDVSKVNSMAYAFAATEVANPNVSNWDTTLVTSMQAMFYNAKMANPDTTTWNTANVTTMESMFYGASVANPVTSSWNTAKVTRMVQMFRQAPLANPDTSGWDTSKVTTMHRMFYLASSANPNTTLWNTSLVVDMGYMFEQASSANPDTSGWNTANVFDMRAMFYRATNANPDTSGWNTAKVNNFYRMFRDTNATPDTSGWDTAQVTAFTEMFYNNPSANPITASWNTSKVTDMRAMFYKATSATPVTTNWDVSKVTRMDSMFSEASSANPDTSLWVTSSVTRMNYMFNRATSANPDTSGWDTSSLEYMDRMFLRASIADPDVSGWDVSKVKTMRNMFYEATIADPDTSSWVVTNCTDFTNIFYRAYGQSNLNYSNFLVMLDNTSPQTNEQIRSQAKYQPFAAAARASLVSDGWNVVDAGAE